MMYLLLDDEDEVFSEGFLWSPDFLFFKYYKSSAVNISM